MVMHIVSHQAGQFGPHRIGLAMFTSCQVQQISFIVRAEISEIELDRFRSDMLRLVRVSQFPQQRYLEIAGFIIAGIANE